MRVSVKLAKGSWQNVTSYADITPSFFAPYSQLAVGKIDVI